MKDKKIALIGGNGQLGNDLQKFFATETNYTVFPLNHSDIEIIDPQSIAKALNNIDFDILINTAAYNKVDEIEKEIQKAFLINGIANKYLAEYSKQKNAIYVSISTDYVFGEDQKRNTPYKEEDCPGPINAYGISKLTGEYFTKYSNEKYFIIRTCGLFGISNSSGKKANFVESVLRSSIQKNVIKVVDDQVVSPTYTYDLAKQIALLVKTDEFGLYHATAEGSCSWYEFAKEIFKVTGIPVKLEAVTSNTYNAKAKRPIYSVLENEKLKKIGIHSMQDWHIGLKEYLKESKYI